MVSLQTQLLETAREAVAAVTDPEIPSIGVVDLGIVRSINQYDGAVVVTITPTYSGCPAMQMIENEIGNALRRAGIQEFKVERVLTPAWSSDWITETGKKRLSEAGIAPPHHRGESRTVFFDLDSHRIHCPLCGSDKTTVVSEFGSTSCKAFYHCTECLSTFEYFKPI